jgi:hypothetical protein
MTDAEHAARIARLRAERKHAGRAPTIQSPTVYRLLAAVLATEERTTTR